MARSNAGVLYASRYISQNAPWNLRQSSVRDFTFVGRVEKGGHHTRHVAPNVGESHDKEAAQQDPEEMAMDPSSRTSDMGCQGRSQGCSLVGNAGMCGCSEESDRSSVAGARSCSRRRRQCERLSYIQRKACSTAFGDLVHHPSVHRRLGISENVEYIYKLANTCGMAETSVHIWSKLHARSRMDHLDWEAA